MLSEVPVSALSPWMCLQSTSPPTPCQQFHLRLKLTLNIKLWSVTRSTIIKATVSGTICFICMISFNPHSSPLTWAPFSPFCRWASWASEKLNNLAKVTQIINLPQQEYQLHWGRDLCLPCSLPYPQHREQWLAHSKCSVNIWWSWSPNKAVF